MAKINNQAVIQKLIDELRLYPGTDLIPTELAEKILPVFQINDTAINFAEQGELKLIRDATANENTRTIIIPPGKVWDIDLIDVNYSATATANPRIIILQILDSEGNVIFSVDPAGTFGPGDNDHLMYFVGALNNKTSTLDNALGFQHIAIPKLRLTEGMGIKIFDGASRDTQDDMITSIRVREKDI